MRPIKLILPDSNLGSTLICPAQQSVRRVCRYIAHLDIEDGIQVSESTSVVPLSPLPPNTPLPVPSACETATACGFCPCQTIHVLTAMQTRDIDLYGSLLRLRIHMPFRQ